MMAEQIIINAISFLLGVVVGSLSTKLAIKNNIQINTNWIAGVITIMWAVSLVAEMINPEYNVSMAVHGIMGAIAAHFFAVKGFKQ